MRNRVSGFAALLLLFSINATAELNVDERRMVEWIDAHAEDAIALLAETVDIGSGTMNHEGVRDVGDVMLRELDQLGLETEWVEMPPEVNRAGHVMARKTGQGKKILLIGHLDTVFESEDEFQSFKREGDTAYGPGIDDMKAGNVTIVYALKALHEIGALKNIPVVVVYSGDEEKPGAPISVAREHLIEAGQWADIALGFESAVNIDDTGAFVWNFRRQSRCRRDIRDCSYSQRFLR